MTLHTLPLPTTAWPESQLSGLDAGLSGGPKGPDTAEKLDRACREFEAVFLRKILEQVRAPMFKTKEGPGVVNTSIYQDMVNQNLAGSISQTGAFGLATSLQNQLGRQLDLHPHPRAALASLPAAESPLHD